MTMNSKTFIFLFVMLTPNLDQTSEFLKNSEVWILQLAIPFHAFTNDRKTICPEFLCADVNPKAVGQVGSAGFASGCQQILVIVYKLFATLLEDGIKTRSEQ